MLLSWLWPLSCSARNHFHTVHIHILQSNRLHCWEKSNFSWLLLTYGNFQDEIEFSDGGVNIWKVHVYVISRWPARPPEAQASQRVKPPTLPFPDHQTSHCLWLLAGPGSALWACGPAQVCVLFLLQLLSCFTRFWQLFICIHGCFSWHFFHITLFVKKEWNSLK